MLRLVLLFSYTLLLALGFPALFPSLHFLYFAPFLIYTFYKQTKFTSLWLAFLCGLLTDLFTSQTRIGFFALVYVATAEFLYSYKFHFFEDHLSTLPILTALFSFLSTLLQISLLYLFGQNLSITWLWVKEDLFWMPLYDASYALIAYSLPFLIFSRVSFKRRLGLFSR